MNTWRHVQPPNHADPQSHKSYPAPARYYREGYYSQSPEMPLWRATLRCLRNRRYEGIYELGNGLWEVGGGHYYVFIESPHLAKRAQSILAKWRPKLNRSSQPPR